MLAALQSLRGELPFELELLDVEGNPRLEQRYGEDVPVLVHRGRELARHRLDRTAIRAYLAEIG